LKQIKRVIRDISEGHIFKDIDGNKHSKCRTCDQTINIDSQTVEHLLPQTW